MVHHGRQRGDLVSLENASVIAEVGVWGGLSATLLAKALAARGEGVLFAVDTWLGAPEFWNLRFTQGQPDPDRDLELVNGYPTVYRTFLSNMVHEKVSEYVVPLPVAAGRMQGAGIRADLIHLDAAHEYAAIQQDIAASVAAAAGGMRRTYGRRLFRGMARREAGGRPACEGAAGVQRRAAPASDGCTNVKWVARRKHCAGEAPAAADPSGAGVPPWDQTWAMACGGTKSGHWRAASRLVDTTPRKYRG
jgi:hypothetical protein